MSSPRLHIPLALAILLLAGCQRKSTALPFEVLEGTVVACGADADELTVKVLRHRLDRTDERAVQCAFTKTTEIYIDDALSRSDDIVVGDVIELIGNREPNPGPERFVVNTAYVVRRERAESAPPFDPFAASPPRESSSETDAATPVTQAADPKEP